MYHGHVKCYNKGSINLRLFKVKVLVAQSCPTLWDPVDSSLPVSSVHGDSSDKNTGAGCYFLLQGIFLTQGWNPRLLHLLHLLHWQADSLPLAPPGKLERVNIKIKIIPFLWGTMGTCMYGWAPLTVHLKLSQRC